MWFAAKAGHIDVVKFLLEKGADATGLGGLPSPAEVAARSGHKEIADLIGSYEKKP